jgi:CDGSH iron-sulfur domain-containing protein 3
MATPNIAQKSPYVMIVKPGTYYWCACGKSAKQPFCDGSHKGSEFSPMPVEIKEEKKVAFCGCKHSQNKPFCDGAHKSL